MHMQNFWRFAAALLLSMASKAMAFPFGLSSIDTQLSFPGAFAENCRVVKRLDAAPKGGADSLTTEQRYSDAQSVSICLSYIKGHLHGRGGAAYEISKGESSEIQAKAFTSAGVYCVDMRLPIERLVDVAIAAVSIYDREERAQRLSSVSTPGLVDEASRRVFVCKK